MKLGHLERAIKLIGYELDEIRARGGFEGGFEEILALLKQVAEDEKTVLDKVFERLDVLERTELDQAHELLCLVKTAAPVANIDRDLDGLAGLTRKAHLHQRVGHAYRWAKHDIKSSLGLCKSFAERDEALTTHPSRDL